MRVKQYIKSLNINKHRIFFLTRKYNDILTKCIIIFNLLLIIVFIFLLIASLIVTFI